VSPPWRSATAPARIIRTHSQTIVARVTKSGGCQPAVVWESHLLRQFRIHSQTIVLRKPGAASVSPPWFALTHLQRRYRHCSGDCRQACWRTPLQWRCRNHSCGGRR